MIPTPSPATLPDPTMNRRAAPHRGLDAHYGDADEARPSKSQLKRQAHDLQALGAAVAGLAPERLAALDIPEALRDAIETWRRTTSHEGRRRQMQYVGKLMRSADEAVLREAVAEAEIGSARATLRLHEAERWRDELIAGDEAFERLAVKCPGADLQHLRSLARQARKDAPEAAPEAGRAPRQGRAFRELFRELRALLDETAAAG